MSTGRHLWFGGLVEIDGPLSDLIQGEMDCRQPGVDATIFLQVSGIADTNQPTIGGEEPSATATVDWRAVDFDVGGAHIAINRGYRARTHAGIGALIAPHAENLLSLSRMAVGCGNLDGSDRHVGPNAEQPEVTCLTFVSQQIAGYWPLTARGE